MRMLFPLPGMFFLNSLHSSLSSDATSSEACPDLPIWNRTLLVSFPPRLTTCHFALVSRCICFGCPVVSSVRQGLSWPPPRQCPVLRPRAWHTAGLRKCLQMNELARGRGAASTHPLPPMLRGLLQALFKYPIAVTAELLSAHTALLPESG